MQEQLPRDLTTQFETINSSKQAQELLFRIALTKNYLYLQLKANLTIDIPLYYYSFPLISALIGWVTNVLAIKSLFHPKEPLVIFGKNFQGVFPKRKEKIAQRLGELVATQLLSSEAIHRQLESQGTSESIVEFLQPHLEDFLQNAIREEKKDLGSRFVRHLLNHNKEKLANRIGSKIPDVLKTISASEKFSSTIAKTVTEKIREFSSDELENLLQSLIKQELKWIEILGGVLGFIIGCLQVALLLGLS